MHTCLALLTRFVVTLLTSAMLVPITVKGADEVRGQLPGLWGAEKFFGTAEPYNLTISLSEDASHAYALGQSVASTHQEVEAQELLSFQFPGTLGRFEGTLNHQNNQIEGHWISNPNKVLYSQYATPVRLSSTNADTWTGMVQPVAESFSLYFLIESIKELIEPGESEALKVRLRNPDRNQGVFTRVAFIKVEDATLRFNSRDDEILLTGVYDSAADSITLPFPSRGGTYELTRRDRDDAIGYYPAPEVTPHLYRTPLNTGDGWPTAAAETVGLDSAILQSLVQSVLDTKTDSLATPYIHSILVARRGQLVLEEYFYGYHADRVHDLRSASKTVTALMTGQAIDATEGFDASSSVYQQFGKTIPRDEHEAQRQALRVSHLLSMTSGFACDDNENDSPGNENTMQSQSTQPDWWEFTLDLPMEAAPGTQGAYCSSAINLLGGLNSKTQGASVQTLFEQGLAAPLSITRYHMNLDPLGRGYGGGGLLMRPRDFLKMGQLMVDKGRWNDQQIVSEQWIENMLQSRTSIYADDDYGYGIWTSTLPYRGKPIPIYSATGNGGQLLIVVPSLELVVGFTGGNYGNFPTWIKWREQLTPEFILRAILVSE